MTAPFSNDLFMNLYDKKGGWEVVGHNGRVFDSKTRALGSVSMPQYHFLMTSLWISLIKSQSSIEHCVVHR